MGWILTWWKNQSSKQKAYFSTAIALFVIIITGIIRSQEVMPEWRTSKVDRGSIRKRITSTGILSGLVQVNIGSQISGIVSDLYVDFNSPVTKGQRLAQIDSTVYEANVSDAQANLQKATTAFEDGKRDLSRSQRLFEAGLISEKDLQAAQTLKIRTESDLTIAKASLTRAKVNLGYCTIKSPVDGVVISRLIDRGQTVAASFNTPNLFIIAQDLTKMKLEANIDEADIGQVQLGQQAFFSVDAFPDTQFRGQVTLVRIDPTTAQNVVSYKVQIGVNNSELVIRPGMTANVTISTQTKDGVLRIPSAALRFNPVTFLPPKAQKKFMDEVASERAKLMEQLKNRPQEKPITAPAEPASKAAAPQAPLTPKSDSPDKKQSPNSPNKEVGRPGPEDRNNRGPYRGVGGGQFRRQGNEGNEEGSRPRGQEGFQGEGRNFMRRPNRPTSGEEGRPLQNQQVPTPNGSPERWKRDAGQNSNPNQGQVKNIPSSAVPTAMPTQMPQGSFGGGRGFVAPKDERVWVIDKKGKLKSISIKTGLSDGQFTEIISSELTEGMEILIGAIPVANKSASTTPAVPAAGMGGMGGGQRGR